MKYVNAVAKGGQIYVDSSLIGAKVERDDVEVFYIPATQMAKDNGISSLANMIIMGKMLKETGMFPVEAIDKTIQKVVSAKRQNLIELNKKAISLGYEL